MSPRGGREPVDHRWWCRVYENDRCSCGASVEPCPPDCPDCTKEKAEASSFRERDLSARVSDIELLAQVVQAGIAAQDRELSQLRVQLSLARDAAFWLDCRYDQSPRGASVCKLEGAKVCALCVIEDHGASTMIERLMRKLRDARRGRGKWSIADYEFLIDEAIALAGPEVKEMPDYEKQPERPLFEQGKWFPLQGARE